MAGDPRKTLAALERQVNATCDALEQQFVEQLEELKLRITSLEESRDIANFSPKLDGRYRR